MPRAGSQAVVLAAALSLSAAFAQTPGSPGFDVQSMTGVVTAVSAASLTLDNDGHAIVFAVTSSTRFIGKGAATYLLYRKTPRTARDFVAVGDRATVKYRASSGGISAIEVRVTRKSIS